jgi:hypothetical protein
VALESQDRMFQSQSGTDTRNSETTGGNPGGSQSITKKTVYKLFLVLGINSKFQLNGIVKQLGQFNM